MSSFDNIAKGCATSEVNLNNFKDHIGSFNCLSENGEVNKKSMEETALEQNVSMVNEHHEIKSCDAKLEETYQLLEQHQHNQKADVASLA